MADHYSKLTRATSLLETAAPHVAIVVLESCIMPYGIPYTIITDDGLRLVSNLFPELCASKEIKLVTATEYHLHAKEQVKILN